MICGEGYLGKSKVPLLFVGKVLEYEKGGGRYLSDVNMSLGCRFEIGIGLRSQSTTITIVALS